MIVNGLPRFETCHDERLKLYSTGMTRRKERCCFVWQRAPMMGLSPDDVHFFRWESGSH